MVSPVRRSAVETVKVAAAPGSSCTLTVKDHLGKVVAIGAKSPAAANAQGIALWSWTVSPTLAAGVYALNALCTPGSTSTSTFDVV